MVCGGNMCKSSRSGLFATIRHRMVTVGDCLLVRDCLRKYSWLCYGVWWKCRRIVLIRTDRDDPSQAWRMVTIHTPFRLFILWRFVTNLLGSSWSAPTWRLVSDRHDPPTFSGVGVHYLKFTSALPFRDMTSLWWSRQSVTIRDGSCLPGDPSRSVAQRHPFCDPLRTGCIGHVQEPITRSQQLPHIPVTPFSQTSLFLAWIYREFRLPQGQQWQIISTDLIL